VLRAAAALQPDGLERVLLSAAHRTMGLAMAPHANALVAGVFEAGLNPGLAGAALMKLVRACDAACIGGA
jgi:hypothetical protein